MYLSSAAKKAASASTRSKSPPVARESRVGCPTGRGVLPLDFGRARDGLSAGFCSEAIHRTCSEQPVKSK
eukprot:14608230-Heterocapsa_arctica.AAC.1